MKTTYIAFLRGVNVGGHRVTMQKLQKLFEQLGLEQVHTYLQSGNVSFTTDTTDKQVLENSIAKHLLESLGYQVPTFVRMLTELEKTLDTTPFKTVEPKPNKRYFVMFISGALPKGIELPTYSPKKDFEIVGRHGNDLFVILHLDVGKPGNPVLFIEKTFKVSATSRFYHTTVNIVQAAKK